MPFAAVFAFGVASVLAALIGAWFVYRELIRYEPRAARHLLPGTELAARLDVEQVIVFEPVRRHLLPLANSPLTGEQGAPTPAPDFDSLSHGPSRMRALRESAGVELSRDLREIVVARAASGAWLLALGGLFPERGLVAAIEDVLRREGGVQTLERIGDVLVLSPGGMALGQAPDGVLLIASSRQTLESALPENDVYEQIGMALEGDGSLVLTSESIRRWQQASIQADATLPRPGTLRMRFTIERPLRLEASLEGHDAETLAQVLASAQRSVTFDSPSPSTTSVADWGAERALLARARVEVDAGKQPKIVTFMELAEFDSAIAWLAARALRDISPPAPRG